MIDFLSSEQPEQQGLPGIGNPKEGFVEIDVILRLYKNPWTQEMLSERTVRLWAEKEYFPKGSFRGLYPLAAVVGGVYWNQLKIINQKQGFTGEEKNMLIKDRIAEQVRALQIENNRLEGKLISTEKVSRVAFSRAKLEAETLDSLPSRLKAILAAETDEFRVGQILKEEIDRIREQTISEGSSKW